MPKTKQGFGTRLWRVGALVLMAGLGRCSLPVAAGTETRFPIPNGDFESGLDGWRIAERVAMTSLATDQAASGAHSLRIHDNDTTAGSSATAARVPIPGLGIFELRGKVYAVSGSGLGLYVRVLDKDGTQLVDDAHVGALDGDDRTWRDFARSFYTPEQAAFLELWLHSYGSARVEAYLDDLHFVKIEGQGLTPPWGSSYKLRPDETDRLTPADVVGPDGIVYPDWRWCGIAGGIPDVPDVVELSEFGGFPDDDLDDSQALLLACRVVAVLGGGAVRLDAGRYDLDWPITILDDGVVIRGQGQERTRLVFRYALPDDGIAFYWPEADDTVGPNTLAELHAHPAGLAKMRASIGDTVLGEWKVSKHSGNSFAMGRSFKAAAGKVAAGPALLVGTAEYDDGTVRRTELPVVWDPAFVDRRVVPRSNAVICFAGRGPDGAKILLAEDGRRGAAAVTLSHVQGLAVGDTVLIDGPATPRWKTLTRNVCQWGTYRRNALEIKEINGNTVTFNQPLRIEFPVADGSYIQRLRCIRRCGIEELSIEQTENLWISTVLFASAWECWARGVTVRMCGRFPVYGNVAKFCEIRNCVFDDSWFKGGGGTAYAGWEHSWDCLMEDVETSRFRHAPLFQWSASGCVIRNSVFFASDGQWHSGWTNENLMEGCNIDARTGNGSYGFGLWASPPEDDAHGPNGPRNVVYNCVVRSPKTGLWMGGMNENWLILYNRFTVQKGQGVFAKTASFDHIIRGNVFELADARQPMVTLATPDCTGVELLDNVLCGGNGQFCAGMGTPERIEGNVALPAGAAAAPAPPVPSIFEWQRRTR